MKTSSIAPKRETASNQQPNSYLKKLEKEKQNKHEAITGKEIIKIEINTIKNRKIQRKVNETKSWFLQ